MGSCKRDNQTNQTHITGFIIAKMLLLLALLVSQAVSLPQKVVFREVGGGREGSEDGCPRRDMVHWINGECFTVGEQGPCGEGKLLDRTGGCVPTGPTEPAISTVPTVPTGPTVSTVPTVQKTNHLGCIGDEILFEGSCHQLASTGPCQPGHWLLLVEVKDGQVVAECQERKCEETSEVWWQPSCSCLGNATVRTGVNPCGEEGKVVVSPYGQGICSYPADTVSQQQFQPRVQVTQDQGKIGNRIFENIPVNDETAFSRATLLNCYVDEANNCRRIFTLGPQPARNQARFLAADTLIDTADTAETLIEWLAKFEKPEGDCSAENEDDIVETA